ncbi:hypothetical protein [Streptomyces sp. NPDC050388]|uniref:hypothetical protein n=1 Tax=Streptomyces sp. NPDC050388 TaxID=3155781 RepID=UPI0034441759
MTVGADDPEARSEWLQRFGDRLRRGDVSFPCMRITGTHYAPDALVQVMEGLHLGTVVAELQEERPD